MIDVNLGGLDLTGRWRVLAVEGWHDTPGFEVPSVERLRHGAISGRGRATGRTIKLAGRVLNTGHAEQAWDRDALGSLFRDGGMVPMTATVGGLTLSTDVQLIDRVTFQPTTVAYSRWEVSLYAPDPHLYGEWRTSTLRPVGAGVGFVYPPFSVGGVITFGDAIARDEWVWNDGNAPSWPVFTVTADSPGGFAVAVGDHRVTYPWPTYPDIPVTVDMAGALTVGGVDQSHLLGERDWSPIPPQSVERVAFELLRGGTGWATVQHRDTRL